MNKNDIPGPTRCSDCINNESGHSCLGDWNYCRLTGVNTTPDEFCFLAERKDHETD